MAYSQLQARNMSHDATHNVVILGCGRSIRNFRAELMRLADRLNFRNNKSVCLFFN